MKQIKNLRFKIVVTVLLLCYTVALYVFDFTCPIKSITGISCFGCGLTRAFISVLRFDFVSAFSYHFMFWSVPLIFVCFLLDGKLFKNKKLNFAFYLLIFLGFILNWISHI